MEKDLDSRLAGHFRCFQDLTEEQARALARSLKHVRLTGSVTIFKEGEPGDTAYFIVAGQVEVRAASPSEEDCALATIGPGQILGEISLLTGLPRTATAVTLGDVELWEMSRGLLDADSSAGEAWANQFLHATAQTLANRLALVNRQVVALVSDRSRPAEKRVAELDRLRAHLFSEWSF